MLFSLSLIYKRWNPSAQFSTGPLTFCKPFNFIDLCGCGLKTPSYISTVGISLTISSIWTFYLEHSKAWRVPLNRDFHPYCRKNGLLMLYDSESHNCQDHPAEAGLWFGPQIYICLRGRNDSGVASPTLFLEVFSNGVLKILWKFWKVTLTISSQNGADLGKSQWKS